MKFLIQKVKNLKIYKNNQLIFSSPQESVVYLVYVGIEKGDENKNLKEVVHQLENLQIIDLEGKFSKTLKEIKPKIVFVSNITLLADFDKGRINFNNSLDFTLAKEIFERFVNYWQNLSYNVYKTDFGSYLETIATNLGPINFYIKI